ncbi:MAG: hypothetical protein JWN73_19 [Betaproteobacteria bacterium]|nr:hypothetical protein [Betaproteobacteria bacterium]
MMYEDNSTEVAHTGMATNFFPMTGIYVKPSKAGNVKITADGAAVNMPVGT